MSDDRSCIPLRVAAIALNIDDILYHLFEVDNNAEDGKRLSRNDLLRCALVSHAFCEPALRTLWGNMSSPTPLWRLLMGAPPRPEYKFYYFDTFCPEILSDKMYMDPARWARFKWYARFIKKLDITSLHMEYKHKELVCALIAHNSGETVFPSLQTLSWPPSSYSDTSYFPLLTRRLRSTILDFHRPILRDTRAPDEVPESHVFLARLLASSPRLDRLTIRTSLHAVQAKHSSLIASFEYLRSLDLAAQISLASFRELTTLPCIECLDVHHVGLDDQQPLSHRPAPIHAPRLQSLRIGGNWLSLTQLFFALDAPVLASVSVRARWDDPPRTMADGYIDYVSCIEALATVASPAALTAVDIKLDEDGGPRICEPLLALLGPFLVFPSITRFSLSCPPLNLVADDEEFWAISESWPKLREFKLLEAYWDPYVSPDGAHGPSEGEGVPIPTPQVLECFREDCPELQELRLPHLDVHADVPGLFTRVPKGLPDHGLRRLWLGGQDVYEEEDDRARELARLNGDEHDKVGDWAQYIRHLFPNLNTEECLRYCRWDSATAGWMEVFGRVRELGKSESQTSSRP